MNKRKRMNKIVTMAIVLIVMVSMISLSGCLKSSTLYEKTMNITIYTKFISGTIDKEQYYVSTDTGIFETTKIVYTALEEKKNYNVHVFGYNNSYYFIDKLLAVNK